MDEQEARARLIHWRAVALDSVMGSDCTLTCQEVVAVFDAVLPAAPPAPEPARACICCWGGIQCTRPAGPDGWCRQCRETCVPPDAIDLLDAHQERVHKDVGVSRAATSVRVEREPDVITLEHVEQSPRVNVAVGLDHPRFMNLHDGPSEPARVPCPSCKGERTMDVGLPEHDICDTCDGRGTVLP